MYRFDHPDILAGQGTMGLEILDQVPDLDACVIPVGGGGLIAGVAVAFRQATTPEFKEYQVQTLANAKVMASEMMARGYKVT